MHLFYFTISLDCWARASLTDEEIQLLNGANSQRLYSDLLDLMV
ncbi:MAG: hypothetical protein RH862_14565 [Leptospiraceae bacterium]